jgi:hypothetical protein
VWNQIGQLAGMSSNNSLEQNARMFALLDTSVADGVIALYDSKYAYHRWRRVTAVRAAANEGNPATTGDPNWTPLAPTAPDPAAFDAAAPAAFGISPARVDALLGQSSGWQLPSSLVAFSLAALSVLTVLVWRASAAASAHATFNLPVLSSQPCMLVLALVPILGYAIVVRRSED